MHFEPGKLIHSGIPDRHGLLGVTPYCHLSLRSEDKAFISRAFLQLPFG